MFNEFIDLIKPEHDSDFQGTRTLPVTLQFHVTLFSVSANVSFITERGNEVV